MADHKTTYTEEDFSFNLETVKSIRVEDNALTFGNTVYQISNISRVTVRKVKRDRRATMPGILLLLWIACGSFVAFSSTEPRANLLGFFIVVVGLFFFFDSRLKSISYIYYLAIEFNSGTTRYFKDESQDFLNKVAYRLHSMIQNPSYVNAFIADFNVNEVFNIYDDHSTHVGGDVLNSFINSGIANGVQGRWSA